MGWVRNVRILGLWKEFFKNLEVLLGRKFQFLSQRPLSISFQGDSFQNTWTRANHFKHP